MITEDSGPVGLIIFLFDIMGLLLIKALVNLRSKGLWGFYVIQSLENNFNNLIFSSLSLLLMLKKKYIPYFNLIMYLIKRLMVIKVRGPNYLSSSFFPLMCWWNTTHIILFYCSFCWIRMIIVILSFWLWLPRNKTVGVACIVWVEMKYLTWAKWVTYNLS